ncbi:MAG: DUF1700 domain-containing protein [Lachnospiraceae bacterium]|nr:DUF1700 domain-containing protein [Lachnospiraceae bacterium]
MRREAFMRQLEALLTDISEEERREALSYYQSYFEDAGEENEERILKELESPEKVAATIKTDLGMEQDSYDGVYTERGYEDERFQQKQSVDLKKKNEQHQKDGRSVYDENKTLKIILIVIIALLTSPVWGGLLAGLLGCVFGMTIGLVATAGALYITGGALFGIGISQFAVGSVAVGFALLGAGMLVWAVAVLLTVFCVWACKTAIPWSCSMLGRLWRSISYTIGK